MFILCFSQNFQQIGNVNNCEKNCVLNITHTDVTRIWLVGHVQNICGADPTNQLKGIAVSKLSKHILPFNRPFRLCVCVCIAKQCAPEVDCIVCGSKHIYADNILVHLQLHNSYPQHDSFKHILFLLEKFESGNI